MTTPNGGTPRLGLEPLANSPRKTQVAVPSGAESGAVGARGGEVDPELAKLNEAWPALSEATRRRIVAIVEKGTGR